MCKDCECHGRMKDAGLDAQQRAEMDLTRNEKEALLWMLRAFRDKEPDAYDTALDGLPNTILHDFCNAWDKLKK